jgi:hypothetical protein
MELREFITAALSDIIQGVVEAQKKLKDNGRYVNPQLSSEQGELQAQGKQVSIQGQLVYAIDFDVAVHSTATGTKGGIGVVAGVVAVGSQGPGSNESVAVSRLKFSVPITLPYGERAPSNVQVLREPLT